MESVTFPFRLDDLAAMRQPVERGAGEAFRAEDFGPILKWQVGRHHDARALIGGGDHIKEQLGTDLRGRHVAKFVEHEQV